MSVITPAANYGSKPGRRPKFGGLRKQFTARVPLPVADRIEARQKAAGRDSLNDQMVADLAEFYGVDLETFAASIQGQAIAAGAEELPLAG